jgi:hypothetical protein
MKNKLYNNKRNTKFIGTLLTFNFLALSFVIFFLGTTEIMNKIFEIVPFSNLFYLFSFNLFVVSLIFITIVPFVVAVAFFTRKNK